MTIADLQQHVWDRLGLRRRLLGREIIDNLTAAVVENWQGEYMTSAKGDTDREIVCMGIATAVKRSHQWRSGVEAQEYGFLWSLILGSVVSAIISHVLKWWLEQRSHRVMLAVWQMELTGGATR